MNKGGYSCALTNGIVVLCPSLSVWEDMFPMHKKEDNFVLRKEVTTKEHPQRIYNRFADLISIFVMNEHRGSYMMKRNNQNKMVNDIVESTYKVILLAKYSHPNSFSCLYASKFFCIVLTYEKGHILCPSITKHA